MRWAAVGSILGGPLGVAVAWLGGLGLFWPSLIGVVGGALAGGLIAGRDEPSEAAIHAILPIGSWLVGAGGGWLFVFALMARSFMFWGERTVMAASGIAAFVGGTIAVIVMVGRLTDKELWR